MDAELSLDAREQKLLFEVMDALTSSQNLSEILARSHAPLSQLLPTECAAMCVSNPEKPGGYEWVVTQMPQQFITRYGELATVDFVRDSVAMRRNQVLRDEEMVDPRMLERMELYQMCHAIGVPLKHVMGVMLDPQSDWHGGLTLYRLERRPFSERDRQLLQYLTPILRNAVRNCREFQAMKLSRDVLESFSNGPNVGFVGLKLGRTELRRTDSVTMLVDRWFSATEREPGRLPTVLLETLARHVERMNGPDLPTPPDFRRLGQTADLRVSFRPLRDSVGQWVWVLKLEELPNSMLPEQWLPPRLTAAEVRVVECVLRGWDTEQIGKELGIAPATVKKHLQHVFDKLGVPNRLKLISLAAELRR